MPVNRRLNFVLVLIAFLSIGVNYTHGVQRGLDSRLTFGFGHDSWSMSVALSRLVFGLHKGYMGYRVVSDTLNNTLAPNGTNDPSSVPHLHSAADIQQALDNIPKLDPYILPDYEYGDGNFISIFAEDIGLADLYTLAFFIFGLKYDAMYKCYFLIFTLSAALFAWEYRRRTAPLAMLALFCVTFSAFMFSPLFNDLGMPSVNANRFGATLGFIPILHAFWSLGATQKFDRGQILRLIAQGFLYAFAMSIRKAGEWQLLLLLITMTIMAWPLWRAQARRFSRPTIELMVKHLPTAGALIFVAAYAGYNIVQYTQLNRLYYSDCAMPKHVTWHSMFIGLSGHPDWPKVNNMTPAEAGGDGIPFGAFERYTKEHNVPLTCPETGGLHRIRAHERVIRNLYLKFAFTHPQYMWELHSKYKLSGLYGFTMKMLSEVDKRFWWVAGFASVIAGLGGAFLARAPRCMPWRVLVIAGGGLLLTGLPSMLAYPSPIMVEVLWMVIINGCLWTYAIVYRLTPVWRKQLFH